MYYFLSHSNNHSLTTYLSSRNINLAEFLASASHVTYYLCTLSTEIEVVYFGIDGYCYKLRQPVSQTNPSDIRVLETRIQALQQLYDEHINQREHVKRYKFTNILT